MPIKKRRLPTIERPKRRFQKKNTQKNTSKSSHNPGSVIRFTSRALRVSFTVSYEVKAILTQKNRPWQAFIGYKNYHENPSHPPLTLNHQRRKRSIEDQAQTASGFRRMSESGGDK